MTEPTTEAGRRLADAISDYLRGAEVEYILAIEAEARADALREAAERVRALPRYACDLTGAWHIDGTSRAAILAILDPETKP